ncbi:Uncharacterized inner membrane transporter yedA [Citrobacter koseri]|uniref:Uncharacterized inner membrane transporter yedA n=1 Tax=Citrobacter koseri TaxID=545 RepID=A0A2X2VL40_CITKO|nr:Uncharacterized inner membrane transporter yedA [Citrobacter koseri]
MPTLSGFMAVGYLALFGSIIAINAYMYLIRNVSPALATQFMLYVNPVVAVLLGTVWGGENLSSVEWAGIRGNCFRCRPGDAGEIFVSRQTRDRSGANRRITPVNEYPACRSARWGHRRRSTPQAVPPVRRR